MALGTMDRRQLESKIARYLKAAENAVHDAASTEHCRDVPKILAIAAQNVGRAQASYDAAIEGKAGRKSRQFSAAIRSVDQKVHSTMNLYARGPCVRATAYEK